jgi:hypothetical protein
MPVLFKVSASAEVRVGKRVVGFSLRAFPVKLRAGYDNALRGYGGFYKSLTAVAYPLKICNKKEEGYFSVFLPGKTRKEGTAFLLISGKLPQAVSGGGLP